jgi:Flp pilus assembly protein TadG
MRSDRFHRRNGDEERGAVAVEFALLLPLLVVILFGIIQFATTFNRQQGIHASAREGARLGSLPGTTSAQIEARVMDALDDVPLSAVPTITITPSAAQPCSSGVGADTVVVEVEASTNLDIPLWGTLTADLESTGEFRCER